MTTEKELKPATAEQIEEKRLAGKLSFDTYYDTSTGIFYAGNRADKFKILPYSKELADVTPNTPLFNGGMAGTDEQYDARKAQEFTRKDMILERRLEENEALVHSGWLASLNGNKKLLEAVVQHVFKIVKDKCNSDEAMGFYIRNVQEKPNIRALCLGRLGYGYWAGACGSCDLGRGQRCSSCRGM